MVPPRPLPAPSNLTSPRPAHLADLGAAAEEIGRLRWSLRQVITLADEAPQLTDAQLRQRLLTPAQQLKLDHQPQLAQSPHDILAALELRTGSSTQLPEGLDSTIGSMTPHFIGDNSGPAREHVE